ncbi:hypothetical protein L1887_61872 [Cichorium endivia]|nr:hypothetical protein L1887_61872 [Cichorium endivia]
MLFEVGWEIVRLGPPWRLVCGHRAGTSVVRSREDPEDEPQRREGGHPTPPLLSTAYYRQASGSQRCLSSKLARTFIAVNSTSTSRNTLADRSLSLEASSSALIQPCPDLASVPPPQHLYNLGSTCAHPIDLSDLP